jgi:hypothetical protein
MRARYRPSMGVGGEERRFVVDVHFDDRIVRLTEGVVAADGLPGADAHAGRRALARFVEGLEARHPDVPSEPRRTCAASPTLGDRRADGWAAWEEHTRICRRVRLG